MSSLKIIIPILIVFILIGAGAYSIYRAQTAIEITDTTQNSFPSPSPSSSPNVQGAKNPPANQPATGPEDELGIKNIGIQLTSPEPQTKINSPVQVTGTANVTSQTVHIAILDSNGSILGQGQATACVGLDACPFKASIKFNSPQTQTGSVEVYSPSTLDSSKTFLQSIPVSF